MAVMGSPMLVDPHSCQQEVSNIQSVVISGCIGCCAMWQTVAFLKRYLVAIFAEYWSRLHLHCINDPLQLTEDNCFLVMEFKPRFSCFRIVTLVKFGLDSDPIRAQKNVSLYQMSKLFVGTLFRCHMELFRWRGVTCLPDNFPIQQKDRLFLIGNLLNFI